jgi:altronate dehydratase
VVNTLRIHPDDNVGVALCDLAPQVRLSLVDLDGQLGIESMEPIPFGHKVALRAIAQGEPVVKYGAPIGVAAADVAAGAHVHTHNLRSVRGAADR